MIKTIETKLPTEFNQKIINDLSTLDMWRIATDGNLGGLDINQKNKSDSGFSFTSYKENEIHHKEGFFNPLAEIIHYIACTKLHINKNIITRVMYNFYTPSAKCELHQDTAKENFFSILYNFHTNDGGTFFEKENKLYKSKESQALVFPSNLFHKGVAPKKHMGRLSLNIICMYI